MPLLTGGLSMCLMPEFLIWRELRDGKLVEVLHRGVSSVSSGLACLAAAAASLLSRRFSF